MNNSKLVSIVLPSFNGSRYIHQSIDSILAQTYDNWELILVDDCSQDTTWSIMQKYNEEYPEKIHCIHHEINRKLPTALNTGFAASKGDYLTWTSDDNVYKPNAIEKMVTFLINHIDVGLVYTDYSTINDDGIILENIEVLDSFWLWRWSVVNGCFLYRKEVYESIGKYSDKWRLVEDHEYWLRIYRRYKLQPLHENLYFYRMHGSSLSSNFSPEVKLLKEKLIIKYMNCFELDIDIKREMYTKLISSAINRRSYGQAFIRSCLFGSKYPLQALKWGIDKSIRRITS